VSGRSPRRPVPSPPATFQETLLRLEQFWSDYGCTLLQPYSSEVGAGTFNPATFFRVLGPEPWKAAYVEPSRRPKDGRYGENPNRLQLFYQYQVVLKPSPADVLEVYLQSLEHLGIDLSHHDVRFVEDDWESPTLGAWGLGWEVWSDGQEVTQFTYFQQAGGIDLRPVTAELTYGLERITMYLQNCSNVYDLVWVPGVKYGDVHHQSEVELSIFNFEQSDAKLYFELFDRFEAECKRLLALPRPLVLPAYDYCMKCSHSFNLLDARGAISVTERQRFIGRVRALAKGCAEGYVKERARLGFPLLGTELGPRAAEAFGAALEGGVSAASVAASKAVQP